MHPLQLLCESETLRDAETGWGFRQKAETKQLPKRFERRAPVIAYKPEIAWERPRWRDPWSTAAKSTSSLARGETYLNLYASRAIQRPLLFEILIGLDKVDLPSAI